MTPITTLTFNPAIDLSTSTDAVTPELKLRCAAAVVEPGGGGINVARLITRLGGEVTAAAVVGGATGAQLRTLLAEEDCPMIPIEVSAATRQNIAVIDRSAQTQYRFVLPGVELTDADIVSIRNALPEVVPSYGYLVVSGSPHPGLPVGLLRDLQNVCRVRSTRLVVDTSGDALSYFTEAPVVPVDVLRLDHAESEELAGQELPTPADTARFARALVGRGVAHTVVFARGAEGSLMVTAETVDSCAPPTVKVVSKVGAGDSFVGALIWRLAIGDSNADALRWAVATAAASVSTPGTSLCTLTQVKELVALCRASQVDV